jgi:Ferritin-like domain
MKKENLPPTVSSETQPPLPAREDIQSQWHNVVRRRSFLKGLGMVGATLLPANALLMTQGKAQADERHEGKRHEGKGRLSKGDADLLRFAAWAEVVESDLWTQYNELGGATQPNDGPTNVGNPAYILALQNLDSDMPQYITDNTDDELSHAAFLNAYLETHGAEPVNLDAFRTLPSSQATGAQQIGRLTNLLNLNVDLSWYTRYRSEENPDSPFNFIFQGPFMIVNEPAIPLNDTDTPPGQPQPVPPTTDQESRMQAIANTAGFHFAFIEQGGSSLYPTLALKASSEEVLRILLSIGGVEIDHFSLWHDKAGNAVAQPLAGVTDPITKLMFPDLNAPPTELTQTNKILPEPCDFIAEDPALPNCSVIRPTSTALGGAVATVQAFTADGLFNGQPQSFIDFAMQLAEAADNARRQFEED